MVTARQLIVGTILTLFICSPAAAQQRGSIAGRIVDAGGLPLPGASVTVTEQNTGFTRTVVTAETGAYSVPNLEPGSYTITVEMSGFASIKQPDLRLTSGLNIPHDVKMQIAGVQEEVTVTGQSPLIETTNSQIGGTLSSQEIQDVPSNFRNFTALTQLIPGITPNPAASTFEGGQVVANGTPSQQNVYLLDGMYNNDDRLGGSQGTQVRVVLDNIEEYQVLSNSYSAEYGGGAGAIINMVTRGGTNNFNGRVYTYFRDDKFNARNAFLPETAPKPDERTLQSGFGVGGPIVRNRAHFYFTLEHDSEQIAGFKRFPAAAAPLATDMLGEFSVEANNYFARGDLQLNGNNFMNVRWLLETAPTRGEGFNTNNATIDAQTWEGDWDHMITGTFTSVIGDRASNVIRGGRIGEELATGAQTYFDSDVNFIGFAGRDPLTIGQLNNHPSYLTGKGGSMVRTVIRTYVLDEAFSYFVPRMAGEHNFKAGGGISFNQMPPRTTVDSGTFIFRNDAPYNPADASTYPTQFDITLGPEGSNGFDVYSKDRRYYAFIEDKWGVTNNLTLNLGLRYDHQQQAPGSKNDFGPRFGLAWDVLGNGADGGARRRRQVLRLCAGRARPDAPAAATGDAVPRRHGDRSQQRRAAARRHRRFEREYGRGGAERRGPGRAQPVAQLSVQSQPAARQRRSADGVSMVVELRRQSSALQQRRRGRRLRRQRVARSARRRRHQRADQRRAAGRRRLRPDGRADSARGARRELPARAADADPRRVRRRLQVGAGVVRAPHGGPLERAAGLHGAAEPLRRRSAIPTPGACGSTTTSGPTTAASPPIAARCSPSAAPSIRGAR